jgi:HMG (high mobility group) box
VNAGLLHLQEAVKTGKVKRPTTAYSRFVAENFASVQKANPELKGVGPIGKLLGKQWSELPESQKVGLCEAGHNRTRLRSV